MSIRMRHTSGHTGNRRSHHALRGRALRTDANGNLSLPHRLDEATGTYRGRQIVAPSSAKVTEGKREKKVKKETREHTQVHELATPQKQKGFFGRLMSSRPKARSGAGGGGV